MSTAAQFSDQACNYKSSLTFKMATSISDMEKKRISEDVNNLEQNGFMKETSAKKTTSDGILLIPQPSDDPDQPLVSAYHIIHKALYSLELPRTGPGARSTWPYSCWSSKLSL